MLDMARKQILPAVETYVAEIASTAAAKKAVSKNLDCGYEEDLLVKLSTLTSVVAGRVAALEDAMIKVREISDITEQAEGYRDSVIVKMNELRAAADEAELITAEKYWPYPTYGDLLFGVK